MDPKPHYTLRKFSCKYLQQPFARTNQQHPTRHLIGSRQQLLLHYCVVAPKQLRGITYLRMCLPALYLRVLTSRYRRVIAVDKNRHAYQHWNELLSRHTYKMEDVILTDNHVKNLSCTYWKKTRTEKTMFPFPFKLNGI